MTVAVAVQPVLNPQITVAIPAVNPVTMPVAEPTETIGLLLLQVPPTVAQLRVVV